MSMHAALQDEMRQTLLANGMEVIDLFRAMDVDKNELITVVELNRALNMLNLDVPPAAVQELFNDIDSTADGGDGLTLNEMNAWMLKELDAKEELLQILREKLRANSGVVLETMARFDADKTGTISISELNDAIEDLGYEATREVVGALFDDLDSDGSGFIAFGELKRWLELRLDSRQQLQQRIRDGLRSNGAKLMRIFNEWDYDHDGKIDIDELGRALKAIGHEASRDIVAHVFHELDRDNSKSVTLQELNRYLLKKMHTKAQLHVQLQEGLRANGHRVLDLFRSWDRDGDALISMDELNRGLHKLGFQVTKKQVQRLFDELDVDANYRINFRELNDWLRKGEKSTAEDMKAREAKRQEARQKALKQKATMHAKDKEKASREAMKNTPARDKRAAMQKSSSADSKDMDGEAGKSKRRSKEEAAPADAPAAAALGSTGAEDRDDDDDEPEFEDHPLGIQTPESRAAAMRRQRHRLVAKGRDNALNDLTN